MQQSPQAQVVAKCKQVYLLAAQHYGLDLSNVTIRFDLKGRCAGMACYRNGRYTVRFNQDMLMRPDSLKDMLEDTVPHELAHTVCQMNPALGENHNWGWVQVCRRLGGTGKRTHDLEVVYGRGKTFEYTTNRGHKVRVSEQRHKQIQTRGSVLTYRGGKGTVSKECAYVIVGSNGRTFAVPIVTQRMPTVAEAIKQHMPAPRPVQQQSVVATKTIVRDWTVQQVIAEATKRLGKPAPLEYIVDAMDEESFEAAVEVLVLDAAYQK